MKNYLSVKFFLKSSKKNIFSKYFNKFENEIM